MSQAGSCPNGSHPHGVRGWFGRVAHQTATWAGRPEAFLVALSVVVIWGVSGPLFGFSDTWQLVINTGTTIVTFLMVFLIQNSQNRDTVAVHLKLDEIVRALKDAQNRFIDLEELEDDELEEIRDEYRELAARARVLREETRTAAERRPKQNGNSTKS